MLLFMTSCEDDNQLDIDIVETGSLISPALNEHVSIDTENGGNIQFEWSGATSGDGGLVLYKVLFDKPDGNFEDPVFSVMSNNNGAATSLSLSQTYLNRIAESVGIAQLETGNLIWTVESISSYKTKLFAETFQLEVTRPEGLATFPEFMYIYGTATESQNIENAVAFKEITNEYPGDNFDLGIFESITHLEAGDYYITNSRTSANATHYYINEEDKLRVGNQATSFTLPEGVYRIRMNLALSTISFEEISNIELVIMANQVVKANLTYVGNHVFEANNAIFNFLTPGAPEAPSWLSWEEERYRFNYQLDGVTYGLGSYLNDGMNASVVPGLTPYNVRPNGDQPEEYYNIYFLGADATQWTGAWKFPDAYNGTPFTVKVVFDPEAAHYYQELQLD